MNERLASDAAAQSLRTALQLFVFALRRRVLLANLCALVIAIDPVEVQPARAGSGAIQRREKRGTAMIRFILFVFVLIALIVAARIFLNVNAPPYPESGREHPFFSSVDDVNIAKPDDPASDGATQPRVSEGFVEAPEIKSFEAAIQADGVTYPITLEATPEVPEAALQNLSQNLRLVELDRQQIGALPFYAETPFPLQAGAAEVRLPVINTPTRLPQIDTMVRLPATGANTLPSGYFVSWPDGWVMVRPYVIQLDPAYFTAWSGAGDDDEDEIDYGLPPDGDVGAATAALTGEWEGVDGILRCWPPDGINENLAFVEVTINGEKTNTLSDGSFSVEGPFTEVTSLEVRFDGRIAPVSPATTGPRISVMNDFHNPRSETVDIPTGTTTAGRLDVGPLVMTTLDCELYNHGRIVLREFHALTGGGNPPAPDDLRIKRWRDVHVGTPYSYYDYIVLAANFRGWDDWDGRRDTIRHEFGHTFRHAADGGQSHWDWDNFRWVYARAHAGTEVFNEHYAFNEGFGQYWRCTTTPIPGFCTDPLGGNFPPITFLDWNEFRVGKRLYQMSQQTGVGHSGMVDLMVANPGEIHTLIEFERAYCTQFNISVICSGSAPVRTKNDCPPGFNNDGATCREMNDIIFKPSYGRGGGTVPTSCGTRENDAGLCYGQCEPGFDGVGPVCWQRCPAGLNDDGAFCRRDVNIIASDNSSCPWYDICGLTFERGCSTCPAGFQNDGCTCRIDAWIFAKNSYGRGGGEIPTDCGPGREYDAGLCYQQCRPGFNGVGPVCWDSCPAGYDDHGGTCYRPPNILVRF